MIRRVIQLIKIGEDTTVAVQFSIEVEFTYSALSTRVFCHMYTYTEIRVYVCWKNGDSLNEIGKNKVAFVYPLSGSWCSCTMIHRDFALEKVRVSSIS